MFYFFRDSSGQDVVVGVLNDYDLSSLKKGPTGRERTGTVPFMALDLLKEKATAGKVEHLYRHDAESFIWVLTWVSLRYEDGTLLSHGRQFDVWLKVDARGCMEKKTAFLYDVQSEDGDGVIPSAFHQTSWSMALSCLRILYRELPTSDEMWDETVFQNWLCAQAPSWLR
jgi:hypothetical protein